MKYIAFLLISFLSVTTLIAQDSTLKKIHALLDAYATVEHFNGSVLVAKNGKVILEKGYGWKNAKLKTKNDQNSIYQIASITKSITSTTVLKLVELGKLSVKESLSKYYPGFNHGDSITIEHLLTHTSGIHNYTETDTTILETDEKRMIPFLKKLPSDFSPGTGWHYSNSNYLLLGYIIQKVSGMSYWDAVRKFVFTPAGMNSSGFDMIHLQSVNKAIGYDELTDSTIIPARITDSTVPFGAGAVYSTVRDLYKFHQAMQANKLISKSTQALAYARPGYGYGWQLDSIKGKRVISHSGSINGFGSNFARIPEEDLCIVVLSNKYGSTFNSMNITRKLLAIFSHDYYSLPVKRIAATLPESTLRKYVGKYEITEMNLELNVFFHEGQLGINPKRNGQPGPTSWMYATDPIHFYDTRDSEVEVEYEIDEQGVPKGLKLTMRGTSYHAKKVN